MLRILALTLCSSCTLTHGFAHRHDTKPDTSVHLSPKMQKLADEQRGTSWAPLIDLSAAFAGFVAGPIVCDEQAPQSYCEPINLVGLGIFAAGGLSFVLGEALFGEYVR